MKEIYTYRAPHQAAPYRTRVDPPTNDVEEWHAILTYRNNRKLRKPQHGD